jgi:hypothetical protein
MAEWAPTRGRRLGRRESNCHRPDWIGANSRARLRDARFTSLVAPEVRRLIKDRTLEPGDSLSSRRPSNPKRGIFTRAFRAATALELILDFCRSSAALLPDAKIRASSLPLTACVFESDVLNINPNALTSLLFLGMAGNCLSPQGHLRQTPTWPSIAVDVQKRATTRLAQLCTRLACRRALL